MANSTVSTIEAVLSMLEGKGIHFNSSSYEHEVLRPMYQEQEALRLQVFDHLKLNKNISLDNDPDVIWGLYRGGYKPSSLNLEYLKSVRTQAGIYDVLYHYKKNRQFLKQFGLKLLNQVDSNSLLHGHWSTETSTGRLKCSSPALQAFPPSVSKYFGAPPGFTRITGDYSLIELKILAQLSQDPVLMHAFNEGIDIHSQTASIIFGKHHRAITPVERQIGKKINFSIIYGAGSENIFANLKKENALLTLGDAKQFRNSFFSTYRGVAQWQNNVLQSTIVHGLSGLTWSTFPSLHCRLNYPIQGSAAVGLKLALILLYKNLKPGWYISHCIHDEIQIVVPTADVLQGQKLLNDAMVTGMEIILTDVPVELKIKIN